ncbi:hypothetical protein SDC9_150804 [bioreactor metagenome]|uniref:Uncharacterized protein n=1 Tax=bioreactor metagenome TaxID=1076179 RepID=A0A645EST0_9ZZZZ
MNVVRQPVVVISGPRPVGLSEPPVIHSHTADSRLRQNVELIFKQIVTSRPAVHEENGLFARRIDVFYVNLHILLHIDIKPHVNAPYFVFS